MKYIKENKGYLLYFLLTMVLFFCLRREYYLYKDSVEYIEMKGYVPPLYPLFLAFFRQLCGEGIYLYVSIWVQGVLAACSIAVVVCYIEKYFVLNRVCALVCYVGALVPYIIETIRGDERRMMSHCILTEGIGMPLFYFWMYFGIRVLAEKRIKEYYGAVIITVLLCLTRAQFLLCFGMDFLLLVYLCIYSKNLKKIILSCVGSMIIGFVLMQGVEDGYKLMTLKTTESAWNSSYLATHIMYVSDENDVAKFEEQSMKDIFEIMYQEFDSIGYLDDYAGDTLLEKSNHWSEKFLKGYWKVGDSIEKYYVDNNLVYDRNIDGPKIVDKLISELFFNIPKSFVISLCQLPTAITYSVFLLEVGYENICYFIAHFILLSAIVLMGFRFRKGKNNLDAWIMLFVIVYMITNCMVTEYMIRIIQRYLHYAQGFFYIAGFLMCIEIYKEIKIKYLCRKEIER